MKRLDKELLARGLVSSRSQAESYIRLGRVKVNQNVINKTGWSVKPTDNIKLLVDQQYVSRAGIKLASANEHFRVNFKGKVVLDVGSSTGGFSDYALQFGAKKIIAVDVGTNQLHPTLRDNKQIELHEQTDIRSIGKLDDTIDIVLVDVSFISVREVLVHLSKILKKNVQIVMLLKPQFEVGADLKHKGVIKNEKLRRAITSEFEAWAKKSFKIVDKQDSKIAGEKGNLERFYLLQMLS